LGKKKELFPGVLLETSSRLTMMKSLGGESSMTPVLWVALAYEAT
jgi:hypothetical protein